MTLENYLARKEAAQYLRAGGRARGHRWEWDGDDTMLFIAEGFTAKGYYSVWGKIGHVDHCFNYSGEHWEGTITIAFTRAEMDADEEWVAHRRKIDAAIEPYRSDPERGAARCLQAHKKMEA
jgi:hypothetical protein